MPSTSHRRAPLLRRIPPADTIRRRLQTLQVEVRQLEVLLRTAEQLDNADSHSEGNAAMELEVAAR